MCVSVCVCVCVSVSVSVCRCVKGRTSYWLDLMCIFDSARWSSECGRRCRQLDGHPRRVETPRREGTVRRHPRLPNPRPGDRRQGLFFLNFFSLFFLYILTPVILLWSLEYFYLAAAITYWRWRAVLLCPRTVKLRLDLSRPSDPWKDLITFYLLLFWCLIIYLLKESLLRTSLKRSSTFRSLEIDLKVFQTCTVSQQFPMIETFETRSLCVCFCDSVNIKTN